MAVKKLKAVEWLADVRETDFASAESYLGLLFGNKRVRKIIAGLRSASIVQFKAKDIFRASELPLLSISNSRVERDWKKIRKRQGLSPLLLVRDERSSKVVIADGYHRLCAVYEIDEDAVISCKIV